MRNVRNLLIWLTAFCLLALPDIRGAGGGAESRFANRKLGQLAELMPGMAWPGRDTIMSYRLLPDNKRLVVRYNHKGEVSHLGISLFSPETKAMLDASICDFLERIILELTLQESGDDVRRKLTEYHIRLRFDGYAFGENRFTSMRRALEELTMPVSFNIRYEGKDGLASWNLDKGRELSLLFPMSKELIDGMDKKESDSEMYDRLTRAKANRSRYKDEPVNERDLERLPDGIYRHKGAYFMIPSLTSDAYYVKERRQFVPLFSPEVPDKSLSTLFQTFANGEDKRLLITHRQYGYFTPEIDLSLNEFLSLFKQDFDLFSATHRNRKGEWETIVVIHHKRLNYIHLLRTRTTDRELAESPLRLKADFFSNIPQHYIKSLFNIKNE